MYLFGAGTVFARPLADANGVTIANPTPVEFGVLQDVSVDFGFDSKELYGQNQFPVDIARSKGKISCKAKAARINGAFLNSIFFGGSVTTGSLEAVSTSVSGSLVPLATPFTITVTPPNSGTFMTDLGLTDGRGRPLTRVASAPATGQYAVDNAGVYTFAAADAGAVVFPAFRYSAAIPSAKKSIVYNQKMGAAPSFAIDLQMEYQGNLLTLNFGKCISNKLSFATKQDDYTIPDFEFQPFQDDTGKVFTWATSE